MVVNRFEEKLSLLKHELRKGKIEVLQVNLGKLCNLTCVHCHVEAGPTRTKENMDRKTAEAVVGFLKNSEIQILDLTGGAPEMNPNFRYLVEEARKREIHVIDRCNLTVFFLPGQEDLAEFLAGRQVEIVASLPCYTRENVDEQRGKGTFDESIKALQMLNRLGYGKNVGANLRVRPFSGRHAGLPLHLNLVYNPVGPHLPPAEEELERDYRRKLGEDFGIAFDRLYTITNMPVTRYAKYLKALNQYEAYQELLINRFNPAALKGLMCRNTLSVAWDGRLYDCDFNQALGMPMTNGKVFTIFNLQAEDLNSLKILTGEHCFGCTAGAGSSCQGAIER